MEVHDKDLGLSISVARVKVVDVAPLVYAHDDEDSPSGSLRVVTT